MAFWLHESFFIVSLRRFYWRQQALLTAGCIITLFVLVKLAMSTYKNFYTTTAIDVVLNNALRKPASKVVVAKKKGPLRVQLSTQALPQTLQFFTSAGFYVNNVEQLLNQRTKIGIGYLVRVEGNFELLINFLAALNKQNIAGQLLHLQSIQRIDDARLIIEFMIKKGER
ncbi:hypothetical protein FJ364_05650 [Candidatus Dependentiae bacterium]|nr:hypothetical protein [Candidatus Dependentiae bacterium]